MRPVSEARRAEGPRFAGIPCDVHSVSGAGRVFLSFLFLILLALALPSANASIVQKSSGLGLARSGANTAKGSITPTGGDFGALLQKPANLTGGSSDFSRLLDMPFKLADIPLDKATVKGVLTPKNIAKALRGGIGGYLAGEAFKRLAEEACVRLVGGSMQLTESGAWEECVPGGVAQVSDGFLYQLDGSPAVTASSPKYPTPEAACRGAVPLLNAYYSGTQVFTFKSVVPNATYGPQCLYSRTYSSGAPQADFQFGTRKAAGSCPAGRYVWSDGTCHVDPQVADVTWKATTIDVAQQKLEDVIKLPANSSKVWDAMRDYADKGGQFDIDSPLSVTGPAQSPASVSTTQSTQSTSTGSQTLTTTNTTVNNYTYAGDTITINQVTTSVTRNEAGQVVSSTTTTGNPQPADDAPVDSPLPPVPDLYVRKYPNGMEGIYDDYKDQLKGTALVQLAKQLMPNISDGGTCPSWPMNFNLASWAAYGVHDVAPPCWIWDVAKAILIFSALLLARSLIFGG